MNHPPYDDLADLDWHWGSAYAFTRPAADRWVAQNRETRATLVAATAAGLRVLVRADYSRRAVAR